MQADQFDPTRHLKMTLIEKKNEEIIVLMEFEKKNPLEIFEIGSLTGRLAVLTFAFCIMFCIYMCSGADLRG
jgi:hypothetical protein